MTGIDREEQVFDTSVGEFDPRLDLVAPAIGVVGLLAGGMAAGDPAWLSVARTLVGAAFLGLRHRRHAARSLVPDPAGPAPGAVAANWCGTCGFIWPVEVVLLLISPGMVRGADRVHRRRLQRHAGLVLAGLRGHHHRAGRGHPPRAAERQYSAVMAATGLLYLAILTAFGTDLVARAILSGDLT